MQTKHQVLYFAYSNKNPVKDFIDSLDLKQKDKIFRLFNVIEDYGIEVIPQHVKKIKNSLFWEIRVLGKNNIRLLFIMEKFSIIILHAFLKKSQKTPPKELAVAFKRFDQWKSSVDI